MRSDSTCAGVRYPIESRRRFAPPTGCFQRLADQIGVQSIAHRPADDASAGQVHHDREIQPTLEGAEIADVGRQARLMPPFKAHPQPLFAQATDNPRPFGAAESCRLITFAGAAGRPIDLGELVEYALELACRLADARVADSNHGRDIVSDGDAHRDTAGRGELDRVRDQIGDDAVELHPIAAHGDDPLGTLATRVQ